jgi:hypothetical protein
MDVPGQAAMASAFTFAFRVTGFTRHSEVLHLPSLERSFL